MPRVDPNNPIAELCAAGMAAEGEGRPAAAKALFEQAWAESRDDYEACIAAHYVARHQETAELAHEWNRRAVERAHGVADERVRDFFASLYLNLAFSLEKLGRARDANEQYLRANRYAAQMQDSPYARFVRMGIANGMARTSCAADASGDIPPHVL